MYLFLLADRAMFRSPHIFLVLLLLTAGVTGCGEAPKVEETVEEVDSFTQNMLDSIKEAADLNEGIDKARAYFDENQKQLKEKIRAIHEAPTSRISDQLMQDKNRSFSTNLNEVGKLPYTYRKQLQRDKALEAKVAALVEDYRQLLLPELNSIP